MLVGSGSTAQQSLRAADQPSRRIILARKAVIVVARKAQKQIEPDCPIADLSLMLEVVIEKRRRSTWEWRVLGSSGRTIMSGREHNRQAAKYQGERAMFLLLAHPKRSSEDAG
jgi:hypothetical protein